MTRRYTNDASKLTAAFVLSESQIYLSVAICFSLSPYCTVILCLQCSKFFLTPFRMRGEGVKANMCPLTSFSRVISANVGISPQNFLTFSFNFFAILVSNIKLRPIASLKLLDENQHYTFEKWFFWSNPYKIEVMNFSYRNTRVSKLSSHDDTYNMI